MLSSFEFDVKMKWTAYLTILKVILLNKLPRKIQFSKSKKQFSIFEVFKLVALLKMAEMAFRRDFFYINYFYLPHGI
jgi:hypothetical protein